MDIVRKTIMHLKENIQTIYVFYLALASAVVGFAISYLYYAQIISTDHVSWAFWLLSGLLLFLSFVSRQSIMACFRAISWKSCAFIGVITLIYFVSHFINFSNAPWNTNGLFDDAAWDIYFANVYADGNHSFQIIFNDTFARISRELVFHYYIMFFFLVFGANLLVFNISLVVLGYVTVLFGTLTTHQLFHNKWLTIVSFMLLNYYPLHFTHVFMGHRYAICAPLLMISFYFLCRAYQRHSFPCAVIGGLFAALCMGSAVMGKQYLYGLAAFAVLYAFFNRKSLLRQYTILSLSGVVLLALLLGLSPLITYIIHHADVYNIREASLLKEFLEKLSADGMGVLIENIKQSQTAFFSPYTAFRQFLPDYPIISYWYLVPILVGLLVSFAKKQFMPLLMTAIPVAGVLVSICYDFRVLISAPFYVLSIIYAIYFCFEWAKIHHFFKKKSMIPAIVCSVLVVVGFGSAFAYISRVRQDANHLWLLPHKDIAISRLIQDIVIGAQEPSAAMKKDEFRPKATLQAVPYDTLAATQDSYAHIHTFLQRFDDKKILSLGGNFPYRHKTLQAIAQDMRLALETYEYTGKDLKLVIEMSAYIQPVTTLLIDNLPPEGANETIDGYCDGNYYELLVLTVKSDDIQQFIDNVLPLLVQVR